MAEIPVASTDLGSSLKPKNLKVPAMSVEVYLKDPPKELAAAWAKDKLIAHRVQDAAQQSLKKARDLFQAAITQLDEDFSRKPPKDGDEAEERVRTLNTVCRQIVEAQTGAACKAATDEWDKHVRKNKDLLKYRALFAVRTTLATIAVAASLTHTVLSFGASSALGILGIAKSLAGMAADIRNQLRDIADTEKEIIQRDATLSAEWLDKVGTGGKAARTGKELLAALGAPFVTSIGGLGKLLTEYDAKNAAHDNSAEKLWQRAKELMASIEEAQGKAGAAVKKDFDKLGKAATELLDQIGSMTALSQDRDQFHQVYSDRFEVYKRMQGEALGVTAKGTEGVMLLAGIASTLTTIVSVAQAIA